MNLKSLRVPAACFIGGVWAVAFLMGMITRDYVALGATTPMVMIVVAAIFTFRNGNGNGGTR